MTQREGSRWSVETLKKVFFVRAGAWGRLQAQHRNRFL